jgi:translation initiation factor eIF-2B subunit delta
MNLQNQLEKFEADRTSGAAEMMRHASDILRLFVKGYTGESFFESLLSLGKQLINAQPTMVPIYNLVDDILAFAKEGNREKILEKLNVAPLSLAKGALPLFNDYDTILTHSYSSSVIQVLSEVAKTRKGIHIIVCESRPGREGIKTLHALKDVETTFIVDAAALLELKQVNKVVVGADALYMDSFVNKIGTLALALGANHSHIPFYVVSEGSKYLPLSYAPLIQKEYPPEEVLQNGNVDNPYFEKIPMEFVTKLIAEGGPTTALDLPKQALQYPKLLNECFSFWKTA